MELGDLLEILGAVALIAGAYVGVGLAAGLAVAGVALVYEGQCYGTHPLPRVKLPGRERQEREAP